MSGDAVPAHHLIRVPSPAELRPVALIWDRTPTTLVDSGTLLARIAECEQYARTQAWEIAGTWVDSGTVAVSADTRPELDIALREADRLRRDERGREREVILLVHSNDRLSNDAEWASALRYRIGRTGARLVFVVENTDTHECVPPAPPAADATTSRSAQ